MFMRNTMYHSQLKNIHQTRGWLKMESHDLLEKLILLKRSMNKIYRRIGRQQMGRTDLIVLMLTGENNEISPGKLSELTGFSKSLITISITNLENAGLIRRKRGMDRRRIRIVMTKKGMEKYGRIRDRMDKNFEGLISRLSKEEIETLSSCMDRIINIIEKID